MRVKKKNENLLENIRPSNRILLDTNILIRALIDDDTKMARMVESADEVHIPLPIFFETIFVLEKIYKQTRELIIDYISTIVSYDNVITDKNGLKEVLYIYGGKNNLSIIDCYLLAYASINNIKLKTLDKDLKKYL